MSHFADVLRLLERMKEEGVVADYAIAGAMAANFWDEAVATQDLDVVVVLDPQPSPLIPCDLSSIACLTRATRDKGSTSRFQEFPSSFSRRGARWWPAPYERLTKARTIRTMSVGLGCV